MLVLKTLKMGLKLELKVDATVTTSQLLNVGGPPGLPSKGRHINVFIKCL